MIFLGGKRLIWEQRMQRTHPVRCDAISLEEWQYNLLKICLVQLCYATMSISGIWRVIGIRCWDTGISGLYPGTPRLSPPAQLWIMLADLFCKTFRNKFAWTRPSMVQMHSHMCNAMHSMPSGTGRKRSWFLIGREKLWTILIGW